MDRDKLADRLMRRLCAYPTFKPANNPDMAQAYTDEIAGMLRDFGSEATYGAITAAIRAGGRFAPSAGELRWFIQSPAPERDAEKDRLKQLLTYYGEHQASCDGFFLEKPCTCGWGKVLSALLGEDVQSEQ